MDIKTKFLGTAIGSMPFPDPDYAVKVSLERLPDAPIWPQLPKLGLREQMEVQYSEGIPCAVIDEEKKRMYIDTAGDYSEAFAAFYETYLAALDPESGNGDCSALAILVSDSGTMSGIRFEDIRVEDCRNTLIHCWIGADMWGHDKTRGRIQGAVFKDIQVAGKTFPVSKLTGFDETHLVEDVTFERLRIQGQLIGDAEAAKLKANAHVKNVRFVTAGR